MAEGKKLSEVGIFRLFWIFFALLWSYLAWGQPYFPTQDGPSHLYNAWVITAIGDPAYPLISAAYRIRPELFPNWAGQAILASLMGITSPAIAEKILFSLLLLGLPFAVLLLARAVGAGRGERTPPWWSLLGFFFALNHPLHKGFQNHGLGLILFVLILAWWWRNRRGDWTAGRIIILNILLIAAYFCHIVPCLISLAAVIFLQIGSRGRRGSLRGLGGLLPAGLLLVYYLLVFHQASAVHRPSGSELWGRAGYLLKAGMLMGFSRREGWYIALSVLLGLGVAGTIIAPPGGRRRKENLLLPALAAGLVLLYFIAPDQVGPGRYLAMRLALYPLFPLLAWLTVPRQRGWKILLICAISLFNLAHWQESFADQKVINRHYRRMVTRTAGIPEHSFADSSRTFKAGHQQLRPLLHGICYGLIGRDIVNLGNYEARLPYFPIRWNPAVEFRWPVFFFSAAGHDYQVTPRERTEAREGYYRSVVSSGY